MKDDSRAGTLKPGALAGLFPFLPGQKRKDGTTGVGAVPEAQGSED